MKKFITIISFLLISLHMFSQGTLYDYGFEGSNSKYVTFSTKWNKTHLKYYIDNTSSHLTASQREHAIQTALYRWSLVSYLTFEQVYSASSADLIYAWKTGSHSGCSDAFDGPGGILGHAKRPTYGIIHFDDDEDWKVSDTNNYLVNLVSVALHETGHALGLDHSSDSSALMWNMIKEYYGRKRTTLQESGPKWTLEVYNSKTGEKILSQVIDGFNCFIDTSSWETGIYVVRATIGDDVYSEKVVIGK